MTAIPIYAQKGNGTYIQLNTTTNPPPPSPYQLLATEAVTGAARSYAEYYRHRRMAACVRLYWRHAGKTGTWTKACRIAGVPVHMERTVRDWHERPPHRVHLPLLLLAGTDEDGWASIRRRLRAETERATYTPPQTIEMDRIRTAAISRNPHITRSIRQARVRGETYIAIARKYGIHTSTARAICKEDKQ